MWGGWGCGCTGAVVWLRACSLTNPVCNASPYCHLRPLWFHRHFRHYLLNGTIFGKKFVEHKMCILSFSTTFVWNISHSRMNSARYCHKCWNVFMWSTRYYFQILMKIKFSPQIFETSSGIKFHQNPSSRSRVVPCERTADRRTDGHDEANSRF